MNVFSKVAVIAGLVGATTFAVANTTAVNQQALAPTQITTVKQALTLKNDTPVQLKGYAYYKNGKVSNSAKYKTSNSKVATINSNDKVTRKKKGTCYVTVSAKSNNKVYTKCKVVVK